MMMVVMMSGSVIIVVVVVVWRRRRSIMVVIIVVRMVMMVSSYGFSVIIKRLLMLTVMMVAVAMMTIVPQTAKDQVQQRQKRDCQQHGAHDVAPTRTRPFSLLLVVVVLQNFRKRQEIFSVLQRHLHIVVVAAAAFSVRNGDVLGIALLLAALHIDQIHRLWLVSTRSYCPVVLPLSKGLASLLCQTRCRTR